MGFESIIGSVAAPILGGILGNSAAQGERNAANAARQAALEEFRGINLPTIEEQKLLLEMLRSEGKLTPELEQSILQGNSNLKDITTDPRFKEAQLMALEKLQDVGSQGGMTFEDKQRLNQIQGQLNQQERGNREAIMQNMAQRGMAGSGFELAAQLANQQSSADRASQQGMDVKAQAERRALEALMNSGQLGGQMQSQDFNQKSQIAQAQDAIDRFNTMTRGDVQNRNITRSNQAQEANLRDAQRIADTNVGLRNQQQISNKNLYQGQFDNQMKKASGVAGQYNNQAAASDSAASRTAAMWSGIGSGVGQGVSAYGQRQLEDERLEKYGKY